MLIAPVTPVTTLPSVRITVSSPSALVSPTTSTLIVAEVAPAGMVT